MAVIDHEDAFGHIIKEKEKKEKGHRGERVNVRIKISNIYTTSFMFNNIYMIAPSQYETTL